MYSGNATGGPRPCEAVEVDAKPRPMFGRSSAVRDKRRRDDIGGLGGVGSRATLGRGGVLADSRVGLFIRDDVRWAMSGRWRCGDRWMGDFLGEVLDLDLTLVGVGDCGTPIGVDLNLGEVSLSISEDSTCNVPRGRPSSGANPIISLLSLLPLSFSCSMLTLLLPGPSSPPELIRLVRRVTRDLPIESWLPVEDRLSRLARGLADVEGPFISPASSMDESDMWNDVRLLPSRLLG